MEGAILAQNKHRNVLNLLLLEEGCDITEVTGNYVTVFQMFSCDC